MPLKQTYPCKTQSAPKNKNGKNFQAIKKKISTEHPSLNIGYAKSSK